MGGASPLTLDMYTAQLHLKKNEYVKRMVSGVLPPKGADAWVGVVGGANPLRGRRGLTP